MPDTLAAGRLRHVMTVQDPVEEQTAGGDVVTVEWVDTFPNVRCEFDFGGPREMLLAAQVQEVLTGTVTLRWRPGIHGKQRLVWLDGGTARVFNIAGAAPDTRTARTWLTLPVAEAVGRPVEDDA